ncbi:hypothetical protein C1H46_014914 [Malus baccata]|uniref:Uncharacterized protein n=1 Tax=Malus baccata TaxID=106549 RepID=A0A540MKZ0_MALBA|nr:hypothetical protein C1H46_014914 [Malus baccata]
MRKSRRNPCSSSRPPLQLKSPVAAAVSVVAAAVVAAVDVHRLPWRLFESPCDCTDWKLKRVDDESPKLGNPSTVTETKISFLRLQPDESALFLLNSPACFLASDVIPASVNSRYARIFRRVRLWHRRNEDERLVADADGSAVAFEGELGDGAVERIDGGEPSGVIVVGVRGWDGGGGGVVPGDGDGEKHRELLLLVMESLHRYLAADAASALEASLILSLN